MGKLTRILAALLLCACGAADEPRAGPLVLSPSEDALELTEEWAGRWSAATGIPIEVREGGAPVVVWNDVWKVPGPHGPELSEHEEPGAVKLCGGNMFDNRGLRTLLIAIDRTPAKNCNPWKYTVGHEIGHAVGDATGHSDGGLMGTELDFGIVYRIDAGSLAFVCESAPCTLFAPED